MDRIRYVSVKGNQLTLTVGTKHNMRKEEFAKDESSIRRKMIQFYTQILEGKLIPSAHSNIFDITRWVSRYLVEQGVAERAWECDRRYETSFRRELYQNTAACLVHHGIWTNRDAEKLSNPDFLKDLDRLTKEAGNRIATMIKAQNRKHNGLGRFDFWQQSNVFPGFTVGKRGEKIVLAENKCVENTGWFDRDKGSVIVFPDAPDDIYNILTYGMGENMLPEDTEYIFDHVLSEVSGIPGTFCNE
ncbi:MAG: hypothetical protein LUE86_14175 [Clostridiales bacterium]|nr:hypothetical protein [Clostridiales bacterium]